MESVYKQTATTSRQKAFNPSKESATTDTKPIIEDHSKRSPDAHTIGRQVVPDNEVISGSRDDMQVDKIENPTIVHEKCPESASALQQRPEPVSEAKSEAKSPKDMGFAVKVSTFF
jgi:hypothetical protein